MKTVDVGHVLDEGHWTTYQKLLIFGTALTIILDGVDNQLLPNAVPTMMREWGLTRSAFANALASGPFGMMIGGMLGGVLGDRVGRRTALLGSAIVFGLITLVIATIDNVQSLLVLRFLAGVGLGGAMPNAAALASEYVPRRNRPFAVTLTIVCIPLGGTIAGQMAAAIIPTYGWRALFVAGGMIPLVLAALLFFVLPESPRFLAVNRDRWPQLRRILRRIGHDVPDDAEFTDAAAATAADARTGARKASIGDLFAPALRFDTIGLFGAFFFCLMANYIGFLVIPAMLTGAGFTTPQAATANSVFNFGGVAGAIVGALVIQRLGSRVTMLGMSVLSIVSAAIMMTMRLDPTSVIGLMIMFTITGGLLNAVQTTMYALAAHVYPTEIRGTGVGTAVAVGRIGNVLASYVGLYALNAGGPSGYFSTWVITMTLVLISLAIVRRHIGRMTAEPAFAAAPARH
jgi:AAHS family 4-hydroxybenzoate transporter-like MFS transporter